jgi:hypothetical protein
MQLSPDSPAAGRPSFDLSQDEIATVVDLLCCGSAEARQVVTGGMLEVPITIQVKKAMRRLKRRLGLTNLQIGGEFELLDVDDNDATVQGRIDVVFQFLHQFGNEDAYLAVECKRVSPDDNSLNRRYVTEGVSRFASEQYASGHEWGMLLAYVLRLPAPDLVAGIDAHVRRQYGQASQLAPVEKHPDALEMHTSAVPRATSGHFIRLLHIFVDMTPAGENR